jgi:hypothetical protein
MMVLALALGYFAFDKFVLDPARDAELVEETSQVTSDLVDGVAFFPTIPNERHLGIREISSRSLLHLQHLILNS